MPLQRLNEPQNVAFILLKALVGLVQYSFVDISQVYMRII